MVIGRDTGFRCPHCGAVATWEVDECDACGYRTEASRGWEREAKLEERREIRRGCLWMSFDALWIHGVVEIAALLGRGIWVVLRGIWSIWH